MFKKNVRFSRRDFFLFFCSSAVRTGLHRAVEIFKDPLLKGNISRPFYFEDSTDASYRGAEGGAMFQPPSRKLRRAKSSGGKMKHDLVI